jgi:putative ABC transport system permease protein
MNNIHLKIAWRILIRQKMFSLINIMGLAIGMAACLLIVQYVSFELSYDNFHQNGDNIYRIKHQNYSQGNLVENLSSTYSGVGAALETEFPEVKEMTRVATLEGMVTVHQPNGSLVAFNENRLYYVEGSFLRLFSFPMVKGSTDALNNPNTIVITESTAKKYFPNQDAIGKTINIQEQVSGTDVTATVTGVCKDVPANSHLQFDFLVSMDLKAGDWIYPDYYTYISLSHQTSPRAFEAKLAVFMKTKVGELSKNSSYSPTQGKSNLNKVLLTLQPLRDIHLYSNSSNEISPGGNGNMVWYLGIIAVLILLIAYINYVNLSTAKVIERAKEVGIRKVLGSQRVQLIKQFVFESLLLNLISAGFAIAIVMVALPWFSKLSGVALSFSLWKNVFFLLGFAGLLALGVLLSATYPALILSNYKPVQVLKGKFMNSTQSISMRKALVVFQFAATITFMIGTLVVYQQINYMKNADKGMDMKQTLVVVAPQNVRATDADNARYMLKDSVFRTEIALNPRVQGITLSSSIPGESIGYIMSYTSHGQTPDEKSLRLATCEIGNTFIKQFGLKIVSGRIFSSDTWYGKYPKMMLNEAAVTSLGFKNSQDAIGKLVETKNGRGRLFQNEVIGVIQNFHQVSLKDDFTPMVFRLSDPNSITDYLLKVNSNNMAKTIAQVEKTYKSIFPESSFQYFFLDDFFDQQYKAEQHFGQVFSLFSGFAVFVAALGLLGLTLITITQRIKEIGIRKVLGASIGDILLLISKDFVGLIAIAGIIALPFAYWGSSKWLENYKFRIHFNAWYFIIPMLAVLLIAVITVSYQSIKAALMNPVKSLKVE